MVYYFFMSLFWIINGILSLFFGIQNVPRKFKNTEYEKPYKKFAGFIYLLFGVSSFVIWLLAENEIISLEKALVISAICFIPLILCAIIGDICFRKRLSK